MALCRPSPVTMQSIALYSLSRCVEQSGGLYRGWSPTCFCRMSNYAYFGSYAVFKSAFTPEGHTGPLPLLSNVAAGGCAGITYWLSCYPVRWGENDVLAHTMISSLLVLRRTELVPMRKIQ